MGYLGCPLFCYVYWAFSLFVIGYFVLSVTDYCFVCFVLCRFLLV